MWRIIGRSEEGQIQIEVTQDLNIPRSIISRASSHFLNYVFVDKQSDHGALIAKIALEDRLLSLSTR